MASAGRRDFVKNGDRWRIDAIGADGSLIVRHLIHGGRARLPSSYVERDTELAYAATTHRVQGETVDTAHVLVTDDTTRETLYVAASRARHRTRQYVQTEALIDVELERAHTAPVPARAVLTAALSSSNGDQAATTMIRRATMRLHESAAQRPRSATPHRAPEPA